MGRVPPPMEDTTPDIDSLEQLEAGADVSEMAVSIVWVEIRP